MTSGRLIISLLICTAIVALFIKQCDTEVGENNRGLPVSIVPNVVITNDEYKQAWDDSLGLKQRERLTYRFYQNRTLQMFRTNIGDSVKKGNDDNIINMTTVQEGNFIVNVYEQTESGWIVGFLLDTPKVEMKVDKKPIPSDGAEDDLKAEVFSFIEKSGRIKKLISSKSASTPKTLNHWRDILSRWQVVLSGNPSDYNWNQTEQDPTGTYISQNNKIV
jgi:hypothetical protein